MNRWNSSLPPLLTVRAVGCLVALLLVTGCAAVQRGANSEVVGAGTAASGTAGTQIGLFNSSTAGVASQGFYGYVAPKLLWLVGVGVAGYVVKNYRRLLCQSANDQSVAGPKS